jgi:hypothetical protein
MQLKNLSVSMLDTVLRAFTLHRELNPLPQVEGIRFFS